MKIYTPVNNPLSISTNPYVRTLMENMIENHGDVEWYYCLDDFWNEVCFTYDIIHIHWPHMLVYSHNILDFKKRLLDIKKQGIKIFATCHNLTPHNHENHDAMDAYDIVYSNADTILHLGDYSLTLYKELYPNASNLLLYHHTYDKLYTQLYTKNEAAIKLGLDSSKKYILCFGGFRNDEERDFIDRISEKLNDKNIVMLAPSFYKKKTGRNFLKNIPIYIKGFFHRINHPSVKISVGFLKDKLLPYYYGIADVAFVYRMHLLNSGNVPLAFLMGKVVLGPNIGNIGPLLSGTGNLVFDPSKIDDVVDKIKLALKISETDKGTNNRRYALDCFSNKTISDTLYNYYVDSHK